MKFTVTLVTLIEGEVASQKTKETEGEVAVPTPPPEADNIPKQMAPSNKRKPETSNTVTPHAPHLGPSIVDLAAPRHDIFILPSRRLKMHKPQREQEGNFFQ